MDNTKTNGQGVVKSPLDTATQEKLNSLDKLLKLRAELPRTEQDDSSPEEDDADEIGGLPGYGGIF
jgi:hypothetical protein